MSELYCAAQLRHLHPAGSALSLSLPGAVRAIGELLAIPFAELHTEQIEMPHGVGRWAVMAGDRQVGVVTAV